MVEGNLDQGLGSGETVDEEGGVVCGEVAAEVD